MLLRRKENAEAERVQRRDTTRYRPAGTLLAAAVLLLAGGAVEAGERLLTVVCTADLHGRLEPKTTSWSGDRLVGGAAVFTSYLEVLREENRDGLLLFDVGDMWQGTLVSDLAEGKPLVKVFNALGCDAAALGNHEFDFGPIGPANTPTTALDDTLGALKQRAKEAEYPMLVANAFERETGNPIAAPTIRQYTLLERQGTRIGVIGVTTENTPETTHPANVQDIEFRNPAVSAREALKTLRAKGAKVIVVLAHMGARWNLRQGHYEGEIVELAEAIGPAALGDDGADLICGGHTHDRLDAVVGGVPLMQAYSHGVAFARADLPIGEKGRVLRSEVVIHAPTILENQDPLAPPGSSRKPRFLGREIAADSEMETLIETVTIPARKMAEHQVGVAAGKIVRVGRPGSPLGNLVTDAMRAYVPEVDLAVTNAGSIRTDLDAGPITYGKLYRMLPFNNQLVTLTLTGEQIRQMFEKSVAGRRGILEFSGAMVTVDPSAPVGRRIKEIRGPGGKRFLPEQRYHVALHDFLLAGGDGYEVFGKGLDPKRLSVDLKEVLIRYLQGYGRAVEPDMTRRYHLSTTKAERPEDRPRPAGPVPPDLY